MSKPTLPSNYGYELDAYESYTWPDIDALMQRFQDCLPKKPYCTHNPPWGLLIRKKLTAIRFLYIQPNSPAYLWSLVFDIDRSIFDSYWFDRRAPAPNFAVFNPMNSHAHFLYMLETPVYRQDAAHKWPQRYAASIDVALTLLLDADPGYSGLICKNPLKSEYWRAEVYRLNPYTLGELASYLDLTPYKDQRRHLPAIGLGRNCTLFDVTRLWAYRQIRLDGWDKTGFTEAVANYAWKYNEARFPTPLPWTEVKSTARSIAKWTIDTMSKAGFQAWGDGRRKKSAYVRHNKAAERAAAIRAFKAEHPDMSIYMIAKVFDVTETTVWRALNIDRVSFK